VGQLIWLIKAAKGQIIMPTAKEIKLAGHAEFLRFDGALLMAWMPPPTGIVMCHSDVSESITQRESIHVRS
jgi:hypothetical protein